MTNFFPNSNVEVENRKVIDDSDEEEAAEYVCPSKIGRVKLMDT